MFLFDAIETIGNSCVNRKIRRTTDKKVIFVEGPLLVISVYMSVDMFVKYYE